MGPKASRTNRATSRLAGTAASTTDLAKVLTRPALIAWLSKQEPQTEFVYGSNRDCLLARYLNDIGIHRVWVGGWTIRIDDEMHEIPESIDPGEPPLFGATTYGAALNALIAVGDRTAPAKTETGA